MERCRCRRAISAARPRRATPVAAPHLRPKSDRWDFRRPRDRGRLRRREHSAGRDRASDHRTGRHDRGARKHHALHLHWRFGVCSIPTPNSCSGPRLPTGSVGRTGARMLKSPPARYISMRTNARGRGRLSADGWTRDPPAVSETGCDERHRHQAPTKIKLKTERPRLHKVILVNDDFTPREFVVAVLKAEFRMSEDQAYPVMMTAHRRGACVVAVYAETFSRRPRRHGRRTPAAARVIRSPSPRSLRSSRASDPAPAARGRRLATDAAAGGGILASRGARGSMSGTRRQMRGRQR